MAIQKATPEQEIKPFFMTVDQAATWLSLGRTMIYALIATDGLPVHRFGKSVRIQQEELKAWLVERREKGL